MGKFYKRFKDYKNCLAKLNYCKTRENEIETDDIILSGIVNHFSLLFDLSWKVMKDLIVEYYGFTDFSLGSPRGCLEKAFSLNLINDETIWISMMKLRNNLAHDYNYNFAREEVYNILNVYRNVFNEFEDYVDKLSNKF